MNNIFVSLSYRNYVGAVGGRDNLAYNRAAGHLGDLSLPADGRPHLSGLDFRPHDVARLQHAAHPPVHPLRVQDAQDTGEFQRG